MLKDLEAVTVVENGAVVVVVAAVDGFVLSHEYFVFVFSTKATWKLPNQARTRVASYLVTLASCTHATF